MSYQQKIIFRSIIVFILAIFFIQCERNNNNNGLPGKYLVDFQKIREVTSAEINTQLAFAAIYYLQLADLALSNKYGVSIYKLSYRTTFLNDEIVASGLVCIPNSSAEFPVLSFQPGTNTCNANAPSVNSSDPLTSLVGVLAGNGYIITIPDYTGFGESSEILHPYIHRNSSDQAVLDLLNAAIEFLDLDETQTKHNGELYLMGYSQGGWATLSALQTIEKLASFPLQPKAASCGAGSYDLVQMTEDLLEKTTYAFPLYLAYFIYSRIENDILTEPVSSYFNAPYSSSIPTLFNGNNCNSSINNALPDTLSKLLSPSVYSLNTPGNEFPGLYNELLTNSIDPWNTSANLLLYHSKGDGSISYNQSETMYDRFLESGIDTDKITLELTDSLDHGDAVIPWGIETFTWFERIE